MTLARVLKLGGSLLTCEDLPRRLRDWLASHPHPCNLLLVGGGELIEAVRRWDACHGLDGRVVHWLCIDLLDTTAQLGGLLFPEFERLRTAEELANYVSASPQRSAARTAIVSVAAFYARPNHDRRLPEDWNTTSDSLAALLATQIQADELVLFKSRDISAELSSPAQWSQAGIVDAAFAHIAPGLAKLSLVNLR